MTAYDDGSKFGQEAMDGALRSFSVWTKGFQQIATETTEFTKRSYDQSTQMFEQLAQSRTLEKAMELQNEYARAAYQNWVSQANKIGEIYSEIARESYKPFERAAASAGFQTKD